MEVFVVYFETGEWDHHSQKLVGIFSSKQKADKFAMHNRKQLDKIGLHKDGDQSKCRLGNAEYTLQDDIVNRFGYISWTGARYKVSGPYTIDKAFVGGGVL